ncbi:cytochrome C, partial [Cytobacillus praedii]|nr:cytochrome C [Cytobacillus praedii]
MKKPLIIFVISALIGLGLGYLVFELIGSDDQQSEVAVNDEKNSKPSDAPEEKSNKTDDVTAVSDDNILQA